VRNLQNAQLGPDPDLNKLFFMSYIAFKMEMLVKKYDGLIMM
jgi:hypothetical protein